jgi:hypothetical protein
MSPLAALWQLAGGIENAWANLVDMAGVHGLNVLPVQPCSMKAGLLCEHLVFPKDTAKSTICQGLM